MEIMFTSILFFTILSVILVVKWIRRTEKVFNAPVGTSPPTDHFQR